MDTNVGMQAGCAKEVEKVVTVKAITRKLRKEMRDLGKREQSPFTRRCCKELDWIVDGWMAALEPEDKIRHVEFDAEHITGMRLIPVDPGKQEHALSFAAAKLPGQRPVLEIYHRGQRLSLTMAPIR